jgi:hypothetical protein
MYESFDLGERLPLEISYRGNNEDEDETDIRA